jgi:hypothetical protein
LFFENQQVTQMVRELKFLVAQKRSDFMNKYQLSTKSSIHSNCQQLVKRAALTGRKYFIFSFFLLWTIPRLAMGQAVGTWTFHNILSGTGSSSNSVSNASLGSDIVSGAFNAGTEYYGEGGWPSGSIDLNAYLQFSLTPNSGHTLSLSFVVMSIRRSTTGTAAGSGPNNWSLRSSLDSYGSDISSGTLTLSSATAVSVALPANFNNLSSTVTFRLYGYNATVSTGGLSRFVYDGITVNGAVTLPILIEDFQTAVIDASDVKLSWSLAINEPFVSQQVEKSENGTDFVVLKNIVPATEEASQQFGYVDDSGLKPGQPYYYRISLTDPSGNALYSPIKEVSIQSGTEPFGVVPFSIAHGGNVRFNVVADRTDSYHFSLYTIQGIKIVSKDAALNEGTQPVAMDNGPLPSGIYILAAQREGKRIAAKIWVQ